MGEVRPVIHVSTPAVVITVVAILGTLVALASINPGVAIVLVIFAFIFGGQLLEYVTTSLADESAEYATPEPEPASERNGDAADALELLRRRYANGELSDAEFDRKLETLVETETVADVERYVASDRTDDRTDPELERR